MIINEPGEGAADLTIAQIIKMYRLLSNRGRAKSLGQHFLCDASLLRKIVACALPVDDEAHIVEVGPGPCGLTREIINLCSHCEAITCIEKDESFKPVHDMLLTNSDGRLKFMYADAMKVQLRSLQPDLPITIVSNLPYNVGTQLLIGWLKNISRISKMVLMFQKEVADRICASPGTKQYGRLSVISQIMCHTERLFDVSSAAFYPPPKVDSTVVRLIPKHCVVPDMGKLETLTAHCFSSRRKQLRVILKRHYHIQPDEILEQCNIDKNARPENVAPSTFLELSEKLALVTEERD
ncbi:MAG: 16S rRNA (adenine(1518)-N(6)/adenine(1519)-N(6))-dimethyltransferase RsmA [Holosporales bacterium]|jgi:16S rRNA (adenine1518-N6/adenine1519-N6)-dimethyltransferase|nr:16S rRNA (adenine(1518)-N(6)/adenine(1519)-N(6))-dimethyltransferase RsmA [Holosporales bacterium]